MAAIYNDTERFACDWLQHLMDAGLIMPGKIDDRSIVDLSPDDLAGYERVHLFAGVAGWERALQLAGWREGPVWTCSCPCPPFSQAGKRQSCQRCTSANLVWCPRRTGYCICADCGHAWLADGRHLWPEAWRLIARCRPARVFGEQVASPDGLEWLAGVRASLEVISYAPWGTDYPAAGVGSPNIRQRLWWLADSASDGRREERPHDGRLAAGDRAQGRAAGLVPGGEPDRLANAPCAPGERQRQQQLDIPRARGCAGPWYAFDIVHCTDGKARRVPQSSLLRLVDGLSDSLVRGGFEGAEGFPLAEGAGNRVGRLRGYGNSINPYAAARFIRAWREVRAAA